MNYELQKKLLASYPKIYRNKPVFLIGDGWFDLVNELSDKIEKMLDNLMDEDFSCFQVSEKHGNLSFSMWKTTDKMLKVIEDAEDKSSRICEESGCKGKLTKKMGCRQTLCENCY